MGAAYKHACDGTDCVGQASALLIWISGFELSAESRERTAAAATVSRFGRVGDDRGVAVDRVAVECAVVQLSGAADLRCRYY